jgi:hypothetical protein
VSKLSTSYTKYNWIGVAICEVTIFGLTIGASFLLSFLTAFSLWWALLFIPIMAFILWYMVWIIETTVEWAARKKDEADGA